MPEPIIQSRVVEISELEANDVVRATLTHHELYNRPLEKPASQIEGAVHRTYGAGDDASVQIELDGEALTRTVKSHWTIELLHRAPARRRS